MSTTEQRLSANRTNALSSTGPTSLEGKATASRNATRHGLLSGKLFLDDEDPADFKYLLSRLSQSLHPIGAIEEALVERIAVTIWRQRRLVASETASRALARQTKKIASGASAELGRSYSSELKPDDLAPFDANQAHWCRAALEEIDQLGDADLATLEHKAPLLFAQLTSDAEDDEEGVAAFIEQHDGGLSGYLGQLLLWCRKQLSEAEARPLVLALAEHVRTKRLVLPTDTLEVMARYQTTLDNQLFKLLRAMREAQEWRLKTLEANSPPGDADATIEALEAA
jgi:hypothetical protein